jgi:hypothetical protein
MSRALVVIRSDADRQLIETWARKAPALTRVEFRKPRRSIPQNDRMWAMLTEIAQQVDWYGEKLNAEDWKTIMSAALRKCRVVPGIDGASFVPLGLRTSDMSKGELSQLMELIAAFGAERGVRFGDEE